MLALWYDMPQCSVLWNEPSKQTCLATTSILVYWSVSVRRLNVLVQHGNTDNVDIQNCYWARLSAGIMMPTASDTCLQSLNSIFFLRVRITLFEKCTILMVCTNLSIRNCALLFLDHLQLYLMIYHYFMQSSILCILILFYLVVQTGKHEYSDHKLKQIFRTVIMISWLVPSSYKFSASKVILSSLY